MGEGSFVTVGDLMARQPVVIAASETIARAIDLIQRHRLRVLPVVEGEAVVGLVGPEHLLRQPLYRPVADVMVRDLEPATPDLLPVQAQALLARYRVDALPVAQNGRLVGVVSLEAVLQATGQHTDPLTGLPWSPALRAWASATLRADREVAILFVDLDNFGLVNKAHGHVAGDDLLRAVAHLLQACIDPSTDVLCRYGGDEFAIATTRREPEVRALAEKIRQTVNLPLEVGGAVHRLTASVGYAGGRRGERRAASHIVATVEDLITRASRASTLDKERRKSPPPDAEDRPSASPAPEARLRLGGITVAFSGDDCLVSVGLSAGGREVTGTATGRRSAESVAVLVARATLEGVRELLGEGYAFQVDDALEAQRGDRVLAAVVVAGSGRVSGRYVGAAEAPDLPHAAARAVLDALNRRVGQAVARLVRGEAGQAAAGGSSVVGSTEG